MTRAETDRARRVIHRTLLAAWRVAAVRVLLREPALEMDGEMQVDTALVTEERLARSPFCRLTGDAPLDVIHDAVMLHEDATKTLLAALNKKRPPGHPYLPEGGA